MELRCLRETFCAVWNQPLLTDIPQPKSREQSLRGPRYTANPDSKPKDHGELPIKTLNPPAPLRSVYRRFFLLPGFEKAQLTSSLCSKSVLPSMACRLLGLS